MADLFDDDFLAKLENQMNCETQQKKLYHFERDLSHLINRYSLEQESNTPDYILASYLISCLNNWNLTNQMKKEHENG